MQIMYNAIYRAYCNEQKTVVESELVFWASAQAFIDNAMLTLQNEARRLIERDQPNLVVEGVGIVFQDDTRA